MSHEQLLADIGNLKNARPVQADSGELKVWQDKDSGLWGLKRGRRPVTDARFITVFDLRYGMAAVRFGNKECGIVNDAGEVLWKNDGCRSVRFLKDGLSLVTTHRKEYYVDLYSWRIYMRKPKVRRFGNVELLELDRTYYSRTKTVYVNSQGVDSHFIHWRKFYLTIYDENVPFPGSYHGDMPSERYIGHACILEGDPDSYYWLYCRLADGSIIIMDNARRYYHAAEGRPKEYIGCRSSKEEWDRCSAEIGRITGQAKKEWQAIEQERMETRRQQLAASEEAVPFQSGIRWGLRIGNRVTIPPVYRNIKSPVGKYCAVEKNYSQWGVVALDGTVMVEPKYSDIEISMQGVVTGTKVTGSKELMKLP